jgi:MFS family permease
MMHMSKRPPSREVGSSAASPEREKGERETTKTTTPVRGMYFDFDSTVRSTTSTGAVKRAMQSTMTTTTTDELARGVEESAASGTLVPPDVMRPFSLLLLSQFVLFVGVGAVIPTIPLYGQSIGLSSASNGIVIGAPALALLLVNRAAGGYADSRVDGGRKRAMTGGMAIIALADLGTAYSSDLTTLVLARLGLGLGRGYAEAGERGMLADLASGIPGLRGRALALQQACVALGIAIGAPLGGIVVQEFGPRSAFLCVSAAAVAVLAIYAVLPEMGEYILDDDERGAEAGDGGKLWRRLLTTSSTWRSLALAQSGASFGFACKIAIVPILADEYLGGPAGAGLLLSAAGLAGLVGAPLGGLLSDRAGSRVAAAVSGTVGGLSLGLVPIGLSLTKLMGSTMASTDGDGGPLSSHIIAERLSSIPSWIDPVLDGFGSPEAVAFVVLVLLWSMGASAQGPALMALAQEKAPTGSEATALGLPRAIGDGTYIVAPLIMGYFCDVMGDAIPGVACTVAGCAIVLGSIALLSVDPSDDDAIDSKPV